MRSRRNRPAAPGGASCEGEGSLHATGAASRGWFVLAATSAGRTKELRYDGHVYASADHAPGAAPAPADRAQDGDVAPAADAEPAPKGGRYPTEAWKAPVKFAQLSPAEQASIMTAAGYKRVGKAWKGCEGSSSVDKDGVEIRDLNGDGRPEAVITASGYECYGNAGQGFAVLRAVPGGWKTMAEETGDSDLSQSSAARRATRTSRSAVRASASRSSAGTERATGSSAAVRTMTKESPARSEQRAGSPRDGRRGDQGRGICRGAAEALDRERPWRD